MAFLVAVIIGAAFGSVDQYLGSISHIPWLGEVSLLSAPWLVLPFVFGCTQILPRRAVLIGCVATAAALVGYFIMTLTPLEGVHLDGSVGPILALLRSETKVIVGGAITGPIFGYLGFRWRSRRAWISAVLVGGAIGVVLVLLAHEGAKLASKRMVHHPSALSSRGDCSE